MTASLQLLGITRLMNYLLSLWHATNVGCNRDLVGRHYEKRPALCASCRAVVSIGHKTDCLDCIQPRNNDIATTATTRIRKRIKDHLCFTTEHQQILRRSLSLIRLFPDRLNIQVVRARTSDMPSDKGTSTPTLTLRCRRD